MKKLALIIALMLAVMLAGCGGQSVPDGELIQTDLKAALAEKNEYANITSTETVKSITEDDVYEITLKVNAETKYSDWEYEVDMTYREYDQGWMLDDMIWLKDKYEQTRIPDENTMIAYATEYLSSHEVFSDVYFTELMFPIRVIEMNQFLDNGHTYLYLSWQGDEPSKYGVEHGFFHAFWKYDAAIDDWVLAEGDQNATMGYRLQVDSSDFYGNTNLDFSGDWYDKYDSEKYPQRYDYLSISDYSSERCVVSIPERGIEDCEFTLIEKTPSELVFSNGEDQLRIVFYTNQVSVHYQIIDNTNTYQSWLIANYQGELPELTE